MEGRHDSAAGRRLSLVLPAYNEEAGVRQAIVEADEALAALADDYEILVVDDGSRDGTYRAVAEEAASRPRVRLLRHETNRGYGAALRTGFNAARFELVAFTDADCQFYLADLGRLLPLTDRFPIAVGWREARKDSRLRCFLSRGYNLLTRTLLGTCARDCDCALKVFRRDALGELLPETNGFFVNVEMLSRAHRRGYEVAEAGVRHRPRLHGKSTVSPWDVPRTLAALLPFWWSSVLFPGSRGELRATSLEPAAARSSPLGALALLLIVAGLLFFTSLHAPLLEPQEPRYAEIPRQMLAEGRLLTPVLNGQAYLDKPPMLYWAVMASYALFGVHDWAARLVPAFAGVLTVLLTYFWGRRVAGERAGLCGALVLCLSARFVYLERMLTMDCLLCLWTAAGLAAAHTAVIGRRLRLGWWLLSAAACALGVLTKGPIALVLIAAPTGAYTLLEPRSVRITAWHWASYLATVASVAGPWYAAIAAAEPGFAVSFFWRHNVVRFVAPFDHAEPFWFHLPPLLLGMLPWTLLLPGFVRFLFRRSARTAGKRPPALGFFGIAALGSLIFFSAAGCKRPVYILPTLPPLALALGCYLNALIPTGTLADWRARLWRRGSRMAYRSTLLVAVLCACVGLAAPSFHLLRPGIGLIVAGASLAGAALVVGFRRKVSWPLCAGTTFSAILIAILLLQPAYNRQYSLRDCLRTIPQTASLPVVCYPQQWESVSFYLPRASIHAYGLDQRAELLADLRARPGTLLLVKSGPLLDDLLHDLPGSVEVVRHGRRGAVTAGWVHIRNGPADDLLAEQ